MTTTPDITTAWDAFWAGVGSEEWLTAKALLELAPALQREAASWVASRGHDGLHEWVTDVDDNGRGWSSTEGRLFRLVAALVDPYPDRNTAVGSWEAPTASGGVRRVVPVANFLELMGSWEGEVWRILTEWGTGGNNRETRGRFAVVAGER